MKAESLKKISLIIIGIYVVILSYSLFFQIPSILLNPLSILITVLILVLTIILHKKRNNFLNLIPKLFWFLFLGFIVGRLSIMPQNKYNRQKANDLIAEIDTFIIRNNRNPEKDEIKLPKAVNGISITDFDFFFMDSKKQVYYIKYSNGLMEDYVYNSLSKNWFLDD